MSPFDPADLHDVPGQFHAEIIAYICTGSVPQNPVLLAILANDLSATVQLCPPAEFVPVVLFLRSHCPAAAWGGGERIADWERLGGLQATLIY